MSQTGKRRLACSLGLCEQCNEKADHIAHGEQCRINEAVLEERAAIAEWLSDQFLFDASGAIEAGLHRA